MRHIRHFLRSSHALTILDTKLRLPLELLILITSYINHKGDLARLCRTSRTFNTISLPLLYDSVVVDMKKCGSKGAIHVSLYRTLQEQRISQLVTHFSATLLGDRICPKQSPASALTIALRRCTCDSYDRLLGEAVTSLSVIRFLSLQCVNLCFGRHTHDHLFEVDAPMLRQFAFRCYGSGAFGLNSGSKKSILTVPFIPNVMALALECEGPRICPVGTESHETYLARPDIAPYLNVMNHDGSRFCTNLLIARPIERLCLDSYTHPILAQRIWNLQTAIKQSPASLSHLFSIDLLQWLPMAIQQGPDQYQNLRFIGTITFFESTELGALAQIDCLGSLCYLEAVEINLTPWRNVPGPSPGVPKTLVLAKDTAFNPTCKFFEGIGAQHSLFRLALLTARHQQHSGPRPSIDSILWERTDKWRQRSAPYFEYWDILCGKLEDF